MFKKLILMFIAAIAVTALNAGVIADCSAELKNMCKADDTWFVKKAYAESIVKGKEAAIRAEIPVWATEFEKISKEEKFNRGCEAMIVGVSLKSLEDWVKLPYSVGKICSHWQIIFAHHKLNPTWYSEVKANKFVIEGVDYSKEAPYISYVCGDYEYIAYADIKLTCKLGDRLLIACQKVFPYEKDIEKAKTQCEAIENWYIANGKTNSATYKGFEELGRKLTSRLLDKNLLK